ncbi:translocase inner membrane subunit 17-1 [Actinidia rufa]|uniref:Translocase inner membrane subunit 17-1 n=1 Tax=Actinidia rufa TaxID=165716 RepID=A0A7J0DFX5_9ERIC|nr:translocase inner membrane subunit 17-1 [Actinidia rufa]
MNAPRVGGGFAVWGGLFSTFDCAAVYLSQKEDPWNSILSGAATGGLLQMRQGLGAASRSTLVGAAVIAAIEGAGIMINKIVSAQQQYMPILIDDVAGGVPRVSAAESAPTIGTVVIVVVRRVVRWEEGGIEGIQDRGIGEF